MDTESASRPLCYLLGASHLTAILRACRAPGDGPDLPRFGSREPAFEPWPTDPGVLGGELRVASLYVGHTAPYWGTPLVRVLDGGRLGITAGLQQLLRSIAPAESVDTVFLSLRGEEYHNLGLAGAAHPFDFHLRERPDLGFVPGRPVLPAEVVEARMAERVAETLSLLVAIRMFCPRHRLVRIPPPPPAPAEAVQHWAERHGRAPHPAQQLPASVQLKLWTLQQRLLAQGAQALGVDSLPVPPAALDERGLLRPACLGDPVHGNTAYGTLVCRQMSERALAAFEERIHAPV